MIVRNLQAFSEAEKIEKTTAVKKIMRGFSEIIKSHNIRAVYFIE